MSYMASIPYPVELTAQTRRTVSSFELRAYSKYDLRMMYGESIRAFRQYYLNDPETLAELKKLDYKKTSKLLNRKMVEVIIRFHGVP
jgi:hypothetical protein